MDVWSRSLMRNCANKLKRGSLLLQLHEGAHGAAAEGRQIRELEWKRPLSFASDDGARKKKLMPLQERKMIDKFRLHVRGGEGGPGCSSIRKGRQSRFGFVDGGNGGRGGDVILVGSAAVWDFSNLQHHLNGTRGKPGSSKKKVGSRGMDKIVQVPVGTVIHLVRGSIPCLDDMTSARDKIDWEDWEDVHVEEHEESLSDTGRHAKLDIFDRDGPGECKRTSSPEHIGEQLMSEPSTTSCQDPTFVKDLVNEEGFQESVKSMEGSMPICLNSEEDETSVSGEDSFSYISNRATGEEVDEDDLIEQEVKSSVAEFVKVGQSLIVASGGDGGKGNASMGRGVGSERGLPSMEHEEGNSGSEADLILELKTVADVGLVGAPNAGKSTLLGSLSMAKPQTGHYKFTTLRPNIGMLEFEDFFNLTVADIPGLIEGAHENRGLGHAFLRHIERTKVLAYVVDLAAGIGENPGPLPWDQFAKLIFELEQYQKGLSQRPSIIVANKIDEEGALEALEEFRRKVPYLEIYPVCAVLEEGIDSLKVGLRNLVESAQAESLPLSELREL